MKYTLKMSGKFKKMIYLIEDDILTLTLIDTGTYADLFKT